MNRSRWQVVLVVSLVALSAALYLIHFAFFRNAHHIFLYLLGDLAFLPLEVLLVTIIIHRLLSVREKRAMLKKLNMVIGAFFSEVGTDLLKRLVAMDPESGALVNDLAGIKGWTDAQFLDSERTLRAREARIEPRAHELAGLRDLLVSKRTFLLALLENPNLLEHERFTDLLWAVFHFSEELERRGDLANLPAADLQHLAGDAKRAYGFLLVEWLAYLNHLKNDYPYLFSLALRTNPFDAKASVVVK